MKSTASYTGASQALEQEISDQFRRLKEWAASPSANKKGIYARERFLNLIADAWNEQEATIETLQEEIINLRHKLRRERRPDPDPLSQPFTYRDAVIMFLRGHYNISAVDTSPYREDVRARSIARAQQQWPQLY